MQTTLTINEPRLQATVITVTAESRAEILLYTPPGELANTWYALLVDGRYYHLIMWKHTIGRAETIDSLDRVLVQVQRAIAALQPPPIPTLLPQRDIVRDAESGDYAMYLDGELVGFARTAHEGETTLDELIYSRLAHRPLTKAETLAADMVARDPDLHFAQALDLARAKLDTTMDAA